MTDHNQPDDLLNLWDNEPDNPEATSPDLPADQTGHLWERPNETPSLFGDDPAYAPHDWRTEWQDMPEYSHEDHAPWRSLPIHFRTEEDMKAFLQLIGPDCWNGKSFWYPAAAIGTTADKRYAGDNT